MHAQVPSAPMPRLVRAEASLPPEDRAFVEALQNAGLVTELVGAELARAWALVRQDVDDVSRRIDLLEAFYAAGGDGKRSQTRRLMDRFFLQRADEAVTASQLIARLSAIVPELGRIELGRVDGKKDGALLLRTEGHEALLRDAHEETLETGEIDLRELERAERTPQPQMVTLRGLVTAINTLLDKHRIRERLVPLHTDEDREAYLATPLTEAIELAQAGYLADEGVEEVMEVCGW